MADGRPDLDVSPGAPAGLSSSAQSSSLQDKPAGAPRRWARFSLRGLLVLTVIAALGFTWVRSHLRVYRQEQQFLAELQQSAGPGAPKTRVEIVGAVDI